MDNQAKVWIGAGAGLATLFWLFSSKAEASTAGGAATYTSSSASKQRIMDLIKAEALRQGVPPELALATAEVESNFSDVKAARGESYGPLQVHISSGYTAAQLSNLPFAIEIGIAILKRRLQQAKGDSLLARIMYFCGPGYQKSCTQPSIDRLKARWAPVAEKWGVRSSYTV